MQEIARGAFVAMAAIAIALLSCVAARCLLRLFLSPPRAAVVSEVIGLAMLIASCAYYFSGGRA
ncbi:hypothetical protein [Paraburkholderia diazotrophica]|uniref:hypothetical protein n=1 Tax=Paraburkholderia diazotrophica TaxID=667676 RepID=UPI000B804938|nr:hypothetical protein [Paraburkholderia diazotrophica]